MTPELRFPGFTEEWQTQKLGDITTKVGSGSTPKGGSAVYRKTGVPFIRSQNVSNGHLSLDSIVYIDEKTHESMSGSRVMPNDILLNITGASLGRTCVVPQNFNDGNVSQHVCIIRLKQGYEPHLVHNILSLPKSLDTLLRAQTGGGKEGLNFQAVRAFELSLPGSKEQDKIAEFLSIIDHRINITKGRAELLKQYKKGVVQKILAQQIRFASPDGKELSGWTTFKLKDVLTPGVKIPVVSTSKYTKITIGLDNKGVRFAELSRTMADTRPFYVRHSGEIIIGKQNYFSGSIAIVSDEFEGTICSNAIMSFRVSDAFSTQYIYEYISNKNFLNKRASLANGTGQKELSEADFLNFEIFAPSLPEQLKITGFILAIDDKIKLEEERLEQAKNFKKSLLQRMFV